MARAIRVADLFSTTIAVHERERQIKKDMCLKSTFFIMTAWRDFYRVFK